MFADGDLTLDGFLGGRVRLYQPRDGFRSSIDAVLLAAAVPAKQGDRVLELGCGAGAALSCLAARVPGLALTGLELQPDYAELARRNLELNAHTAHIRTGDISNLPADLRQQLFDHVLANPPYFQSGHGTAARDDGRELALREGEIGVEAWVKTGLKRLRSGGTLTMIFRTDALPRVLAALPRQGRGACALPVQSRMGREATRIILLAVKDGRAAFEMRSALTLHAGEVHLRDGEDYLPAVRAILRDGAPLTI